MVARPGRGGMAHISGDVDKEDSIGGPVLEY